MRFIHTSDVNLGCLPDPDHSWSRDRAEDLQNGFRRIVESLRGTHADCLLISGNLFHRQPLKRELADLNYLFASVPAAHVLIVSGPGDKIRPNSSLLSFSWASNVIWFTEGSRQIYLDDIHTEVVGISQIEGENVPSLSALPKREHKDAIRILLLNTENLSEFSADELKAADFDYIALGGKRQHTEGPVQNSAFPGSPEPLSMEDSGAHGYLSGSIHPVSHSLSLEFHENAVCSYIPLTVSVTKRTGNAELLRLVSEEIERRGPENIYRLRIRGHRNPDTLFQTEDLCRRYRIIEVQDESEPEYDFSQIYHEHPDDLLGYYIHTLKRDEYSMSAVEKKALYYGIDALIRSGKEEV